MRLPPGLANIRQTQSGSGESAKNNSADLQKKLFGQLESEMIKRASSLLAIIATALGGIGLILAVSTLPAVAKDKKPGLSAPVYKILKAANDLAIKNPPDYAGALVKLKEAEALPNLPAYDAYEIHDMKYQFEAVSGDYTSAAVDCQAAWDSNQFSPADKPRILKALVELYHANKDDVKAKTYADQYLKEIGPDFEIEAIAVDIDRLKGDSKAALAGAQDLIKNAKASNTPIKEVWWRLLLLSASSAGDNNAVKTALFGFVEDYPSKDAWHDLAANLYNRAGRTNSYALQCLRLMDAAGALSTSSEYLSMVQLAVTVGLPGEAKQIIKNGEAAGILPGSEKTLAATLKKQANNDAKGEPGSLDTADKQAAAGKSGASDLSVGEEYAVYGMYDKATAAINRGLSKSASLKTPDQGRISLGWVNFLAGKYDDSKTAFESVKTDAPSMELAKAWLILIKNKVNPPAPSAPTP